MPDVAPLRVLHYVNHAHPVQDGYTLRTSSIARAQMQAGLDVAVVDAVEHDVASLAATGIETDERSLDGEGTLHLRPPRDLRRPPSGPVARVRSKFSGRTWWKHGALQEYADSLQGADIVHAHTPSAVALDGALLAEHLGARFLYEVRGYWDLSRAARDEVDVDLADVVAPSLPVCARAVHVTTAGRGVADLLVAHGVPATKVTVMPNCVDAARFQGVAPDAAFVERWGLRDRIVFGCATNVRRLEGLQVLAAAWPEIQRAVPEAVFVLLGDGPFLPALREIVKGAGSADSFLCVGRVPHAAIAGCMAAFDAYVVPRVPAPVCEIVAPLKPLEAMAAGVPVVASDVGGLREVVEHGVTGLLATAGDASALAAGCIEIGRDAALRTRLAGAAYDWVVRERDWRVLGARYRDLYAGGDTARR